MATVHVDSFKLTVFRCPATTAPLFESAEVSRLLGYAQEGSLRKQTLLDWQGSMTKPSDYVMVQDDRTLDRYSTEARRNGHPIKNVTAERGRLFFTPEGLIKVLNRSTKNTEPLRAALARGGYLKKLKGVMVVKDTPTSPPTPPTHVSTPTEGKPLDVRKFEYDVLQRLLKQLTELSDESLRELAILAAETALGRSLDGFRGAPAPKKASIVETTPPPKPTPHVGYSPGPIFTHEDFYSMTRIGELAGGYTARQAGLAANIVAARMNFTADQIRTEQLPINQIAMRPDSTSGKKRQMVRFCKSFANEVVHELRTNVAFEPDLSPGIPTVTSFEEGSYPSLARGPFDS